MAEPLPTKYFKTTVNGVVEVVTGPWTTPPHGHTEITREEAASIYTQRLAQEQQLLATNPNNRGAKENAAKYNQLLSALPVTGTSSGYTIGPNEQLMTIANAQTFVPSPQEAARGIKPVAPMAAPAPVQPLAGAAIGQGSVAGGTQPSPAAGLPPITANLAPGSTGPEVAALQNWLISKGFSIPSLQSGKAQPGFYGPETQAAVAAWQKSIGLQVADPSHYGYFGPLSRKALQAGTAVAAPGAPTTPTTPTEPKPPKDALATTIDAIRSLYGLGPVDPNKTLVQRAIEDYQAIYSALGISDVKTAYNTAVKEFSDLQTELNDKIADINEDPWLSEGVRRARIARLQERYETKLNTATQKMNLLQSLVSQGTAQANALLGHLHNVQASNIDAVNKAIEIVQKQVDAANDLDTEVVEAGGRKKLINSKTGEVIADLGVAKTGLEGPSSYQEWILAGSPGTYADWLQSRKPPTIGQETVATYAARLEQSSPILDNLEPYIQGLGLVEFEGMKRLHSSLQTDKFRQFDQAARNFINATLRRESGAVISEEEFANAYIQYLPRPGDDAQTLLQKRQNREVVYRTFKNAAGPAYQSLDELLGTQGGTSGTLSSGIQYTVLPD